MIEAAKEDDMGTYVKGAMDRVVDGSKKALKQINLAASK